MRLKSANSHLRSNIIIRIVFFLFLFTSLSTYAYGKKTGELSSKITKPVSNFFSKIYKLVNESGNQKSNSINIRNETIINTNSSESIRIINPTSNTKQNKTVPIYNGFSTPTPNPALIKWQEEFDKKKQEIEKSNKQSLEEFCKQMPSASVCQ